MEAMSIYKIREKYKDLLSRDIKYEETLTDHIFGAMEGARSIEEMLLPATNQKQKMYNILQITKFMKSVIENIEYNANTQIKLIEIEEDSNSFP